MPKAQQQQQQQQQQLHLCWNDHSAEISTHFNHLFLNSWISDVTLICSNLEKIFAHKILLCAASDYFESVFKSLDDGWMQKNPVLLLKEIDAGHVKSVLEFVYTGRVNIEEVELSGVLNAAKLLGIKGLQEAASESQPIIKTEGSGDDDDDNEDNYFEVDQMLEDNFQVSLLFDPKCPTYRTPFIHLNYTCYTFKYIYIYTFKLYRGRHKSLRIILIAY